MRFTVSLLALMVAGAAHAEDFQLRADISQATVYLSGAQIGRSASIALPAGEHRVLLAISSLDDVTMPQVSGPDGVEIGTPSILRNMPLALGALDTADQARAREAVEAAQTAVQEVQDRIALADAALRGMGLQISLLEAIARGGETGTTMPSDPSELAAQLAALGSEMNRIATDQQQASIDRRRLTDELTDKQTALREAQNTLDRLRPFGTTADFLAVDVTAETATELALDISHFSNFAGWSPAYEFALNSENESLAIERSIILNVQNGEIWRDVDVTFSTANPNRQREPGVIYPSPVRIGETPPQPPILMQDSQGRIAVEAVMAPSPMAQDASTVMTVTGFDISYAYQTPVSVSEAGSVTLPFDTLEFEAALTRLAQPRFEQTAFLMAGFENTSGEPILPGPARFMLDGGLVGEGWIEMIPDGADQDMAFGALDHLRLDWRDLSRDEGDRGIFSTSNTQSRRVQFTVENTSGADESLRVIYATPFSEQEDLEIDLDLSIAPSETDVDGKRGVMAWNLDVPAGEAVTIEMSVDLAWPEGQTLFWQP